MISFPARIGSFLDNDGYQLAAFLLGFGLVFFEDKSKGFSQVRNGLFLGLALADGLRQLDASSCVVTRFLILPKTNSESALTHFQSVSSVLQASISTCRLQILLACRRMASMMLISESASTVSGQNSQPPHRLTITGRAHAPDFSRGECQGLYDLMR